MSWKIRHGKNDQAFYSETIGFVKTRPTVENGIRNYECNVLCMKFWYKQQIKKILLPYIWINLQCLSTLSMISIQFKSKGYVGKIFEIRFVYRE